MAKSDKTKFITVENSEQAVKVKGKVHMQWY